MSKLHQTFVQNFDFCRNLIFLLFLQHKVAKRKSAILLTKKCEKILKMRKMKRLVILFFPCLYFIFLLKSENSKMLISERYSNFSENSANKIMFCVCVQNEESEDDFKLLFQQRIRQLNINKLKYNYHVTFVKVPCIQKENCFTNLTTRLADMVKNF